MALSRNQFDELRKSLAQLFSSGLDDAALRERLNSIARQPEFSALTWQWGPDLYKRDGESFSAFLHQHFSAWHEQATGSTRIAWNDHANRLDEWLAEARVHRDSPLIRKLLAWKYASEGPGIDSQEWNRALTEEFLSAPNDTARSMILSDFAGMALLDELTSIAIYQANLSSSPFVLQNIRVENNKDKRQTWRELIRIAEENNDSTFADAVFRKTASMEDWRKYVLHCATTIQDPQELDRVLENRHPDSEGRPFALHELAPLLELRGEAVCPYLCRRLASRYEDKEDTILRCAAGKNLWFLWSSLLLTNENAEPFHQAMNATLDDLMLDEISRLTRLQMLAGKGNDENGDNVAGRKTHLLTDEIATKLYRRYPSLLLSIYRPNIAEAQWPQYPALLEAALYAQDEPLIDLLAMPVMTCILFDNVTSDGAAFYRALAKSIDNLTEYYESLHQRDPLTFLHRAASIMRRVPARVRDCKALLSSNRLARLLFVRSFDLYHLDSRAVRDLLDCENGHVVRLGLRVLAQERPESQVLALEFLAPLLAKLRQRISGKSLKVAMGALANAARADEEAAKSILSHARELLQTTAKPAVKEDLTLLIARILTIRPELRSPMEIPLLHRCSPKTI